MTDSNVTAAALTRIIANLVSEDGDGNDDDNDGDLLYSEYFTKTQRPRTKY